MTTDVILVLCTAPPGEGRAIASRLVEEQLVACVNTLGPIRSTFRWKGAVEEDEEALLVMKTRRGLAGRLRERIAELHSYDVPEVLEVAVEGGLPAYLAWVAESCPETGTAG